MQPYLNNALAANKGNEPAKEALKRLNAASLLDGNIGKRIKLTGLQAKPEMNGESGVVLSSNEATGHYAVQLNTGGQPFMLKRANIEPI